MATKKYKISVELFSTFKPLINEELETGNIKKITMNNKYIYDEKYENEQMTQQIFVLLIVLR